MDHLEADLDVLDQNDVLLIEMGAMRSCLNRQDSQDAVVVPLPVQDDDYRSAIAKMFGDSNHWQPWMMESLLKEFKDHKVIDHWVDGMSGILFNAVTQNTFYPL